MRDFFVYWLGTKSNLVSMMIGFHSIKEGNILRSTYEGKNTYYIVKNTYHEYVYMYELNWFGRLLLL